MKHALLKLSLALLLFTFQVTPVLALTNDELLEQVNSVRISQGVAQLSQDSRLNDAAIAKLADMQAYKYWSHNNPVTGEPWWKYLYRSGIRGKTGENLSRGYRDSTKIVNAWDASPTHHANLFNKSFKHLGVAIGEVEYPTGIKTVVITEFSE